MFFLLPPAAIHCSSLSIQITNNMQKIKIFLAKKLCLSEFLSVYFSESFLGKDASSSDSLHHLSWVSPPPSGVTTPLPPWMSSSV